MPYIIAIVIIVIAAVGFAFMQNKGAAPEVVIDTPTATTSDTTGTTDTMSATPDAATSAPVATTEANDYKDGTYKTQVTYFTPNRDEYLLDVSLTIKDDVVTDSKIIYSQGAEVDPNPQRFEKAYRTEIIGKDIDTLNLSRVGGASLTTAAFNNALTEIKADAEA
ncbi:MAG TPA: hypothetical protein VGE31_01445 [Candidatus Paceibacterota bacterium]